MNENHYLKLTFYLFGAVFYPFCRIYFNNKMKLTNLLEFILFVNTEKNKYFFFTALVRNG